MTGSFKLPVITFGDALSQAWLAARGLDAFVNKEERMDLPSLSCSNRWLFYRLSPPTRAWCRMRQTPTSGPPSTARGGTRCGAFCAAAGCWRATMKARATNSGIQELGERERVRERESQLCEKSQFFGRLPSGPLLMNWPPDVGPLTATPSHTPPRGRKRDT